MGRSSGRPGHRLHSQSTQSAIALDKGEGADVLHKTCKPGRRTRLRLCALPQASRCQWAQCVGAHRSGCSCKPARTHGRMADTMRERLQHTSLRKWCNTGIRHCHRRRRRPRNSSEGCRDWYLPKCHFCQGLGSRRIRLPAGLWPGPA